MAARLQDRGPDGEGFRIVRETGFGHTRLSIIDAALDAAGFEVWHREFLRGVVKAR